MISRPALFAAAALLAASPMLAHAADDADPTEVVEEVIEDEAEDEDGKAEGADLGEASYNTRNCEDADEGEGQVADASGVEADDLDAECEPMRK